MDSRSLITLSKHSVTLTPNLCNDLLSYTRYFVYDSKMHLDEYLRELERFKEHVPEQVPTKDRHVFDVQQALVRAESILTEFEPLTDEMHRTYKRNYITLANVLRQTRRDLGQERIEDIHTFKVYLDHLCRMLYQENDMFSREKFINCINER
jgi:hypothetical protein